MSEVRVRAGRLEMIQAGLGATFRGEGWGGVIPLLPLLSDALEEEGNEAGAALLRLPWESQRFRSDVEIARVWVPGRRNQKTWSKPIPWCFTHGSLIPPGILWEPTRFSCDIYAEEWKKTQRRWALALCPAEMARRVWEGPDREVDPEEFAELVRGVAEDVRNG